MESEELITFEEFEKDFLERRGRELNDHGMENFLEFCRMAKKALRELEEETNKKPVLTKEEWMQVVCVCLIVKYASLTEEENEA